MALSEVDISLNIQNNRDYPQQINVMGNPANLLDTANATTEFRYDVTTFTFTNENSVSIQYKLNGASSFNTFTGILPSKTLQGVVIVLNTLQIGYFNTYTQLGSTYISTYNNNYTFGAINIFSSTTTYGINPSFVSGTGFNGATFSSATPDYLYVAGAFTNYNGTAVFRISKIDANSGVIDNTFAINSGTGFDALVYAIAIQSDGKILAVGVFTSYNGNTANSIARINTDGTIDNTLLSGIGFDNFANYVLIQNDGKILVGGEFGSYNGTTSYGLIRLNIDGSIDATLNVGTGFFDNLSLAGGVNTLAIQNDGKIIVGGSFNLYNGSTYNGIIRLNTNGSVDSTFNIGTGFAPINNSNLVNTIVVQTGGKILVGGNFSSYNGTAANKIIRLNANGSVDTSFVYGTGFNGANGLYIIALQSNGQLLVGGDFTQYNGSSYNSIIRLNTNGSIDTSWVIGTGFIGGGVQDIEIYFNTIFVTGGFSSFNGTPQGNISNLFI
jgi:uncharacterized delta-60 repeat protein